MVEPRDCPVLGPRPTLSLRGCCGCVAPMGQPGFLTGWEPPPSLQAPTSELRPPVKTDSKHPARPPRPVPALFSPRIPGLPSNTSVSRRLQACPRLHPPHNCHRNALQQAKTALPHRALAPGASQAGETEAGRAQQPPEPWQAAGGCLLPPRSLPRPLRPVRAGSGVGAALEQGFPALCSPPAPRAHGRHVISCSFFAPLIISAPVRRTARPCRPSPTSSRPQGGDPSAGRFRSPQPWQRGGRQQHAGRAASHTVFGLNQTFMLSPGGFQAQTVCTESGSRQPEPWELQPPLSGFFIIFFFCVTGQSLHGNFRQWSETGP